MRPATSIQSWWDAGHGPPLRLFNQRLPVDGHWMDSSDPLVIIVSPPARILTPDRVRNRMEDKLGSYKNLAGEQLGAFRRHGLLDALGEHGGHRNVRGISG